MGWFSKPKHRDCVWMNDEARLAAIVRAAKANDEPLWIVAFFEASLAAVAARLRQEQIRFDDGGRLKLVLARDIPPAFAAVSTGPEICVVEHHPLPAQKERLLKHLEGVTQALPTFHVALDEPLLARVGGERIVAMMQQLGMAPDEMVSHPMVSKALANARDKIAKQITSEQPAPSMAEWFKRNL